MAFYYYYSHFSHFPLPLPGYEVSVIVDPPSQALYVQGHRCRKKPGFQSNLSPFLSAERPYLLFN